MTIYTADGPAVPSGELVKGERVQLANGWHAEVRDNMKRSARRLLLVHGVVTELGEVYTHDIVAVWRHKQWCPVEHTSGQLALRERVRAMGW